MAKKTDHAVGAQKGSYQPVERYGHTMALAGDKAYLWAGGMRQMPVVHASGEKEAIMSTIETFNLKSGKWECHRTRGSSHSGVNYYATATIDKDIYYFGGHCGHGNCCYNNITKLDTAKLKWHEIKVNPFGGPMKKHGCGMVSFKCDGESYLFVVGGYGQVEDGEKQPGAIYSFSATTPKIARTNEQHILSLSKNEWISPQVLGECPPPCSGFTFTSIGDNRAIMFGGYQSGKGRSDDVYIAQMTKNSVMWTKLMKLEYGPWPPGRCDHAVAVIPGNVGRQAEPILVVAGGMNNDSQLLGDCWLLNIESVTWTQLSAPEAEVGRILSSMSIMNIGAQYVWLILFGGAKSWEKGKSTRNQGICSDTTVIELGWKADVTEWAITSVIDTASLPLNYQPKLKDRLAERRRSLGLD